MHRGSSSESQNWSRALALELLFAPVTYTWTIIAGTPVLLFVGSLLFSERLLAVLVFFGSMLVLTGIGVLAFTKPLPKVSEASAFANRMAWFGKFSLASIVFVGGVILSQAISSMSPKEAFDFLPVAMGFLLPLGAAVLGFLLLLDLYRIPTADRFSVLLKLVHKGFAIPAHSVHRLLAAILAGASNPVLVTISVIFLIVVVSTNMGVID